MAKKDKAGVYVRFYRLIDSETHQLIRFETRAARLWQPGDPEPDGSWVWYSLRQNSLYQESLRGNPTDSRGVLEKADQLYRQALQMRSAVAPREERLPLEEELPIVITERMRWEAVLLAQKDPPGCGPGSDEDD